MFFFFFSSRRRHTRYWRDWSSDVCSSDLAIREFETLTSTYDAAFGRSGGAQVNVVLKSGTNEFHGSLYEFHRNGALDARNFFAPASEPAPKYIRNQFGFAVGGPLRTDRTFFR